MERPRSVAVVLVFFYAPTAESFRLRVGRGHRWKSARLPCKKTPVTVLFAPNRKETEDTIALAGGTGGFYMSATALQGDASGGKREVSLLKLDEVVFGAPAGNAFHVGFLGVH